MKTFEYFAIQGTKFLKKIMYIRGNGIIDSNVEVTYQDIGTRVRIVYEYNDRKRAVCSAAGGRNTDA
ncbi:MAG: hypothetical protein IJK76_00075 [Bacteroidales bacterium]|nr:hypothetical protein [Bacteroidales bacterium]